MAPLCVKQVEKQLFYPRDWRAREVTDPKCWPWGLGQPRRFDGGKPVGPPLTRNRNAAKKKANYNASKAACKVANGGQPWNWHKVQCDEYPFQSTNQGATNTNNPSSARLLSARQNLEAGIQPQNWYAWDRILDGDQFWVHVQ